MQEYHNVQPVDNQKANMAIPIDENGDDVAMVVQAEIERQSIERQSSTDTSNLESGSEGKSFNRAKCSEMERSETICG